MRFKAGVRTTGTRPELILAIIVANQLCREKGIELVITSLVDGVHSIGSLHYAGAGFDMRTRNMASGNAEQFADELRVRLGEDYDVVLESDPPHIHVEWQPKQPL